MPERDGYIAGVPCWVDTSQPDPDAAAGFLRRSVRLGVRGRDAGGVARQVFDRPTAWRRRGGGVIATRGGASAGGLEHLHLGRGRRRVGGEGARSWRQRSGRAVRRDGRRAGWRCSPTRRGPRSASGRRGSTGAPRSSTSRASLNFNVLNTRDPEAAKRFYGAVFGWTTLDLGSGEFWTLRAYGDYLEELTPGTRERTAELGAAGFEDVVAAITPIAGDDADTHAQLERHVLDRRRRRDGGEGGRVRRHGARRSARRAVLATDRAPRPAGSDVLRDGVRAREQGRRPRGRLSGPGNRRGSRPRTARLRSPRRVGHRRQRTSPDR